MEKNIYREALSKNFRFNYKGSISVEDLFFLNENSLNEIYKNLLKEKKNDAEDSLFETKNEADKELETKIEILKDIAAYKKEQKEKAQNEIEAQKFNKEIDKIIAEKKLENLKNSSIEELEAMKK